MVIIDQAKLAKKASIKLGAVSEEVKNKALNNIAESLWENREDIVKANEIDIKRSIQEGLAEPLIKRLKFQEDKINDVIEGIKSLIDFDDPVGKTLMTTELDEDLTLYKVTSPIGVIGIIFESRPDALVQISTLCLKSGNSVLLKGGSEAFETNRILFKLISEATNDLPDGWINLLESRADVIEMLNCDKYIDLLIPRGSNEFVRYIMDNTKIPVMGHADGICHSYVDKEASIEMAVKVALDSKTQYVSVCNATETLLVHQAVASIFLPLIAEKLEENGVILYGCPKTKENIKCNPADDEAWRTEYLDYALAIKVVESLDEAINHINTYGSGHTDAIITKNMETAAEFMQLVDSGNVLLNCSTRFSDGYRYGFGAEVGISTSKLHARGPVGLDGLLSYKYKLIGNGNIVDDYSKRVKTFTHKKIDKDCPL